MQRQYSSRTRVFFAERFRRLFPVLDEFAGGWRGVGRTYPGAVPQRHRDKSAHRI